MLLNKFVAIYGLFLFCSLAVGLLAAVYGLMVLIRSRAGDCAEKRHHLEKYLYLSTSAIFLGAVIRLVMIPLWFLMLHGLIPSIPGAMCLAGVHLNVPQYSWMASSMKLILPWLYFTWIFISTLDRRMPARPYFKLRQGLLVPLILFLFGEAFFDLKFITGLTPTPVTCCTAIFDFNTEGIPPVLTETHWYFVLLFFFSLMGQLVTLLPRNPNRWRYLTAAMLSPPLFVFLLLALHTRLSPLILGTPFHHCLFCLLQTNIPVLMGTMVLFTGACLTFAFGLSAFVDSAAPALSTNIRRIKITICSVYTIGTVCIAIPTLFHLFSTTKGL